MEPIQFKKSLFGFSKEQVMEYITRMDRKAGEECRALMEEYNAQLSTLRRELETSQRLSEQYQSQAAQSAAQVDGLRQQVAALSEKIEEGESLRQRLEETAAEREEWKAKYAALEEEMERASREALERERRLSEFIDRVQEKNVELLQKQVAMEIRLSSAERKLCSSAVRMDSKTEPAPAQTVDQSAKEEIIAALDAILTKLDVLSAREEDSAPGGRVYRLAEQN